MRGYRLFSFSFNTIALFVIYTFMNISFVVDTFDTDAFVADAFILPSTAMYERSGEVIHKTHITLTDPNALAF